MFWTFKADRRLKELQERLETVERGFKKVQLEWEDSYDRFRTIVQRIAKRAQTAEKLADEAEAEETPDVPDIPGLTPQQREKQMQILSRRSRLGRPS